VLVLVAPLVVSAQRVDTWDQNVGPLDLSGRWQPYPGSSTGKVKAPPAVGRDEGRSVLRLETDHESVAIWRQLEIDPAAMRYLVWEWKVMRLPVGGDVRVPTRNDQAARVMVLFEGMKAIVYLWDTSAPVGTVIHPDTFALVVLVFVVVKSGSGGVGRWHRERRDVYEDYRRLFGERPRHVRSLGLESHSDDVASRSAVVFGPIGFYRR
jgi:hypothetical protein